MIRTQDFLDLDISVDATFFDPIANTAFVILADDRNPSPPPELTGESGEDLIHADSIGDTVFSKHWLFTTLMKLIQVRPKKSPDR